MAINFSKVSGVIRVQTDTALPKSYISQPTRFYPNPAGDGFIIFIGDDSYSVLYTNMQVNGQAPSTMTTASTLLTALFGT